VLPSALSAANQRNRVPVVQAPSILDVAHAAGFETYWITNQPLLGAWDNLVSILAEGADHVQPLNRGVGKTTETSQLDSAAVPALEAILRTPTTRNRLIVVHLMGSHFDYCKRYPPSFARYSGRLARGEFGAERKPAVERMINCYDNSVLYDDFVVSQLLRSTQRIGGVSAFLYFSDHGEDVLGVGGHNSADFTYPMVEVPLVVSLSRDYERAYPARAASLAAHTGVVFPTDFIFDTVLGIAGIESDRYEPFADLSDTAFRTSDVDLRAVRGTRPLLGPANARYHQRRNIAMLSARHLTSRVLPHRVATKGMLAEILYDGFRSLELDLLFRARPAGGSFEVGHDEEHASGNDLADVLALMPQRDMQKLWFDVKNLSAANVDAVRRSLRDLDAMYDLKRKIIVESPAAEQLGPLGADGFHTSYYLPTELLLRLEASAMHDSLELEAARIAALVRRNEVRAVSFDARLYVFVKDRLERRLPSGVVFHTWDLDLSLGDPDFMRKLEASRYVQDARVATILVRYESQLAW